MEQEIYLISQKRRDGTFPGLHKVVMTGFHAVHREEGEDRTYFLFDARVGQIFTDLHEAQTALARQNQSGLFYHLFRAKITVEEFPLTSDHQEIP